MATIQRFEDLLMWQKARLLTKETYRAFARTSDHGFTDQIQRAAVSVMSNIAEGFESGTREEFINYLFIAKGSAGEVRAQLYAASDIGYVNIEIFKSLKALAEDCSRLIASFIGKSKQSALPGLQRKNVPHVSAGDKWYDEELKRMNLILTSRGMMDKDKAAKLGLEDIRPPRI